MSNFSTKKRKQPLKDDFDSDETNVADSSTPVHTEKKQKKSNTAVKRTNTDWSKREAVEKKFSTALEPIVTEYLQGLAAISSRTDGSKKSGVLSTASGATSAVGKAVKKVAKNVLEKNALFREAETKEFASADPKFWQILASTEGGKQLADTFVICYDAKHGTVVDEATKCKTVEGVTKRPRMGLSQDQRQKLQSLFASHDDVKIPQQLQLANLAAIASGRPVLTHGFQMLDHRCHNNRCYAAKHVAFATTDENRLRDKCKDAGQCICKQAERCFPWKAQKKENE